MRKIYFSRIIKIVLQTFFFLLCLAAYALELKTKPFQVCTNKTCSKRGSRKTISTFSILKQKVERCSCVSKCGEGPNVLGPSGRIYNGVEFDDITLISAIIEIETGDAIPSTVMTAVSLVSDANKTKDSVSKHEKLTKAIQLLLEFNEKHEETACFQEALSMAFAARSEAALDTFRLMRNDKDLSMAKEDALQAIANCNTISKAYWNLAEVYEIESRFDAAIDVLQKMELALPEFSDTIRKQVDQLKNRKG